MTIEDVVNRRAFEQGFALVGFARLKRLEERVDFYRRWLESQCHADMSYLARDCERRFDPRTLDPRLRSVVSLAFPYAAPNSPPIDWRAQLHGRIASYAIGPDYHGRVLTAARAVARAIECSRPGALTRIYVDTGPVFERQWAAQAGLGWFGKNTNLINKYRGSYFFLSEIFTDLHFDCSPLEYRSHCGRCRRCLDLCPTQALSEGYVMDSHLCISYLTIEHRGPIPAPLRPKLGNWIFGCDICQDVCPWNDSSCAEPISELMPRLPELMALDDDEFARRFGKSAIRRAKRRGLLRNAAVALGNSGNPDAVPVLAETMRREGEAIVRGHAAWALGRLGGVPARRALESSWLSESDAAVRAEIEAALAGSDQLSACQ
jgi:epoxyqueuosine reductase